jgi:catalase
VKGSGGTRVEADATLENSPSVLFDAVIVPPGTGGLAALGQAVEFVKDQFRHCKTILVMGDGVAVLEKAGIAVANADRGLIVGGESTRPADQFIQAMARHRHWERETDPPRV